MSDWAKSLFGVDATDIPSDATARFEFANLPGGGAGLLAWVAILALIAGVFWIYKREGSASLRIKYGLAALRALMLIAAILVILEPILAIDRIEEVDKSTVIILDDSLSLSAKDRYTDPARRAAVSNATRIEEPARVPRFELVNRALQESGLPGLLAKQNEVKVFAFSDGARPHATVPRSEEGGTIPGIDPTGADNKRAARGTNIAGAIRQVVEEVGSDRIAAIVLVSDGRSNLGPPAADVALFLNNKDLKLHTVVVGEAQDPRNLRAIGLAGPDRVFKNDPVALEAQVSAQGFGAASVEFERRYTDGSDDWETVKSEQVTFENTRPVTLRFTDRPPRIGIIEYRIRMDKRPDESTHQDNEKSFVVRVIEEKVKVLFIAGAPAYEYYAIKNTLLRDTTITVACYLQSADPEFPQDGNGISLEKLPEDEKELFEFDVVLMHDPNGQLFPPNFTKLLKKFVAEHRGGLGFICGNKHTLSLLRDNRGEEEGDLSGILPVILDLDRADMPGSGIGYGGYFTSPWNLAPDPAAFTHPCTRFGNDPQRARDLVWDRLPPLFWFFPVLKAKAGATVLAVHADPREVVEPYGPRPIVAVHRYGGGNVFFAAADETHRWRDVAEPIFDRFWVQTVRFLLEGRHAGKRRRFRIFLDREVAGLGDAVQVSAQVYTESYQPLEAGSVEVDIRHPASESREILGLTAIPGKDGHFSGSYAPPALGDYELRPEGAQYKSEDPNAPDTPAASFMVILPDREMGNVKADRTLMRNLAARTRGVAVEIHDLEKLGDPKLIPPASERIVTQGRPVPLWDTWTTVIAILTLLCAEWILRKRFRMV
ncbi:MAG: hypothetical protein ACYTHK_04725 [Planctomycetota bacterium]|jgi:hypothetical protein